MMGMMSKALVDELIRDIVASVHDAWVNKAVCTCRVWLSLFDDVDIDVVKVVFAVFFVVKLWPWELRKVQN